MSRSAALRQQFARHLARPETRTPDAPAYSKASLSGRLCELSGAGDGAALTAAMLLVLDAQNAGETCAWITRTDCSFFPPDAERNGVDLEALVVIRTPNDRAMARAADTLARSGAFGLIVLDFAGAGLVPIPIQSRLVGLVQKQNAALVALTYKEPEAPSLGSLFFFRGQTRTRQRPDGLFDLRIEALKDKGRGPGWSHEVICNGPPGLC
jgi:recombination protein RecA